MADRQINIGGKFDITPAMIKAAQAAKGLDESFSRIKDAIIILNKNGTKVGATLKLMSDDFRVATVNVEKFFSGQQRGWQATSASIKNNVDAVKKASIAEQRAYAISYDAAQRYNEQLKARAIAEQKAYAVAYDAAQRYNAKLDAARSTLGQVNKQVQSFLLSWQSVARIFAANVIRRALYAISGGIKEAIDTAKELEIRISEIRTIAQDVQLPFETWSRGLRELSDDFGFDILDQAEAAYQTLSNQVAKGAETFEFLREANKFARTAVTDTATSVDLLTGAINAYRLDVKDAEAVSAILFKTIELGRLRASDMSDSFGDIAVLANQLGISLNELTASIDTLTIQGIKYNKAATQLRGIFTKIIKPTKDMTAFLRDMGFETGEAALKTLGFGEFIKRLQERTKGSSTELAKYISRVRGLSGALAFSGEGFDIYTNALTQNKDALLDYQNAQKIVMESAGFIVEREIKRIKNYFTEDFGRNILSTIAEVNLSIGGFSNVISNISKLISGAAQAAVIAYTAKMVLLRKEIYANILAMVQSQKQYASFTTGLKANSALLIGEFIAIYSVVSTLVTNELDRAAKAEETYFKNRVKNLKAHSDVTVNMYVKSAQEQLKILEEQNRDVDKIAAEIFGSYNKQIDSTVEHIKGINKEVEKSFAEVDKGFKEQIKTFKDIEDQVTSNIEKIIGTVDDLAKSIEKEKFDISLGDTDKAADQIKLIEGRLKSLEKATQVSIDFGDVERVQELLKERFALEKQITKIAQNTSKENKKAEEERKKIITEIAEAESKLRNQKGKDVASTKKEIAKLQKDLSKITTEDLGDYFTNYEKRYDDLLAKARNINLQIIEDQIKKDEMAHKKRVQLEIQLFNLTSDLTAFKDFDIGEVAKTGDIEDINKAIAKQIDLYHELVRQQDELGINGINQAKLRISLEESSEVAQLEIRKKILQQAQDNQRKVLEQIKEEQDLRDEVQRKEQSNINKFLAQAEISAKRLSTEGTFFDTIFKNEQYYEAVIAMRKFGEEFRSIFKSTPEGTKETLVTIEKLTADFIKAGGVQGGIFAKNLGDIYSQVIAIDESFKKIDSTNLSDLESVSKQYNEQINALRNSLGIEKQTTIENDKQKGLQQRKVELLDVYKRGLEEIIRLEKQYTGTISNTQQTFANGGKAMARGSDRVPALLSPGEFVMNASATRKFYGQLVAMNSGVKRFANGGPVTNVGDVNISMSSSGSEAVDIVRIGKGLRRAIRRGKVQL